MQANYQEWTSVLKAGFEEQKKNWQQNSAASFKQLIRQSKQDHFSLFLKKGFPSFKDPFWQFTNINSVLPAVLPPVLSLPLSHGKKSAGFKTQNDFFYFPGARTIHFQNGCLEEPSDSNLPAGVKFCEWKNLNADFPAWPWISQKALKEKGDGFYHLTGAFPLNGYVLYVASPDSKKGKNAPRPVLHVHFSFDEDTPPSFWNFKNVIFLEQGAELTVIESVSILSGAPVSGGGQKHFINSASTVKLSPKASLNWLCLDHTAPASIYLNQAKCDIEKASRMHRLDFSLGSGFSRSTVKARHLGEKALSVLLSLAVLKEKAVKDKRSYIHHLKKEGKSMQLFRGILNDRAKNIFHAKTYVSSTAHKTDCEQSAKNLLLSNKAEAHTQPELEIHCGDVKARHGATAGRLNQDELFYLQSRGLEQKKALKLLIMAYIKQVLNPFPEKSLTKSLIKKIQQNQKLYLNL